MFTEEQLEDMTMLLLDKLNYECKNGYDIERDYHSVFYDDTLFDDIANINRDFTDEQINEAIKTIKNLTYNNVVEDNVLSGFEEEDSSLDDLLGSNDEEDDAPVKKGRGRPRKLVTEPPKPKGKRVLSTTN